MKKKNKSNNMFESKELKRVNYANQDYNKIITFIILVVILCACLGGLFYFNGKYVSKDEFQNETTTTTEVSFDSTTIIVDEMFKIADKEYYVLAYDKKDKTETTLYGGFSKSFDKENVELYVVDLSDKMNSKYYDKKTKTNVAPTKASEVMFSGSTLLTFKDGKVTSCLTDKDAIYNKLMK